MARLQLVTGRNPERLLRHAADGFLAPRRATAGDPFPTVPYLLAVRQGGVRDDVIEMAAVAGVQGWFDPPLCIFAELPNWLAAPARHTLATIERRAIIGRLLRNSGAPFARVRDPADYAAAVDALVGELIAGGVSAEQFAKALAERAGRDAFESGRDGALAAIYAAYRLELEREDVHDGRDALGHCARAIAAGKADLRTSLRGRRELRIYGLQDLRGGWLRLLEALAASPALDRVVLYSAVTLPLAPLPHDVVALNEPPSAAARLFACGPRPEPGAVTFVPTTHIRAPDGQRELAEVARRVRTLVTGGAPPHRIAIVARESRPRVDEVLAALERVGVPATARRRVALAQVPAVRALDVLLTAAAEGWTRRGLASIARQPYFACGLSARVIDHIGYRRRVAGLDDWAAAIARLDTRSVANDSPGLADVDADDGDRRGAGPPHDEIASMRANFGAFADRAREFDHPRSLAQWIDWLTHFLDDDSWGMRACIQSAPGGRLDVVRLDLIGLASLSRQLSEWRRAVAADDGAAVMTVAQFAEALAGALAVDVALWTPGRNGVQVLEALAAAYRSFDHLFVVGAVSGEFPRRARTSPILDEGERRALAASGVAVDGASEWDVRERELFRVLVAGARETLTVSCARLDGAGRDVVPSVFLDALAEAAPLRYDDVPTSEIIVPGTPLYRTADALACARHAARIERTRTDGLPSPYAGQITDPELRAWLAQEFSDQKVWSPTELESFARCPWAYFSSRLLGIVRIEELDDAMEPKLRGIVLHDALQHFYRDAGARVDGPVFLREGDAAWALPMIEQAVNAAFDAAVRRGWAGHPALRDAKRAEMQRIAQGFISWEIDLHARMEEPATRGNARSMVRTGVTACEVVFDDLSYQRGDRRLRFRGRIDRVEESTDERIPGATVVVAYDYKTTKGATPGAGLSAAWADGVVLQVPLYAHALAQLRPGATVARVGYLTLTPPGEALSLARRSVKPPAKRAPAELIADDKADARWTAALDAALDQAERARQGAFPAAPPAACGCPSWCHGRDICRIPGGPRDAHH